MKYKVERGERLSGNRRVSSLLVAQPLGVVSTYSGEVGGGLRGGHQDGRPGSRC